MIPKSYLGCAGTGKTTALFGAVKTELETCPLQEGQRLLAITRMNGARHRLDRLLRTGTARLKYDCRTIDSLAWMIASRWRSRAHALGLSPSSDLDFDGTCAVAAALLNEPDVARWLGTTYPVVVVDEFQDCREARLLIVQRLASTVRLYLAADDFQNLESLESPAVSWLRAESNVTELVTVHRTSKAGLLTAASLIREGRSLPPGWGKGSMSGFSLVGAMNHNAAAKLLAQQIHWSEGGDFALLSPAGPGASAFVRATLTRLASEPRFLDTRGAPMGPYHVSWELGAEHATQTLLDATRDGTLMHSHLPGAVELSRWFERKRRLEGKATFAEGEIRSAVSRAVQRHRAHFRPTRGLRGMTVHQAKNQEFGKVVVLWPVQTAGSGETLSRLLYNAVTRAKSSVVVIVQNLDGRLSKPPFLM